MIHKTASQKGIDYLYHWEKLDLSYLDCLLRTNSIYCSNPGDFNDPWDSKPHYNTSGCYVSVERTKIIGWIVKAVKKSGKRTESELEAMKIALERDPSELERTLIKMNSDIASGVRNQYRVYCFGTDPYNLLMWSHYAKSHSGICLQFEVRNTVVCAALECTYSKEYPIFDVHDDSDGAQLKGLLSKSDVWTYESEYRLIAQDESYRTEKFSLITKNNYLELPKGTIKSIIVGCRGNYEVVKTLVDKYDPTIQVKRAILIPNEYKIEIV